MDKMKNRGIWCGKIVSMPVLDHQITDHETNTVVREYYAIEIEVNYSNEKGTIKDTSILPVLVSKNKLDKIDGGLSLGDILFAKGEWRAYKSKKSKSKKVETRIHAYYIQKQEKVTRNQNKIELFGFLAGKLYKAEFDESGKMKYNYKGKPIHVLDENGNKIPWVRRNPEGFTVNDVYLEVEGYKKDSNGNKTELKYKDFIPCIAFGSVAWKIKEIEQGSFVQATGYVRKRKKNKREGYVYEVVITEIEQ